MPESDYLPPQSSGPADQETLAPAEGSADWSGLPEVFGRYRVRKRLGEGGMGAVYLAEDTLLGRQVALKVPFVRGPEAEAIRARFLQEARSFAALHHRNICPVYDLGEIDSVCYMTMAYIPGEPLSKQIGPGKPLPSREAAEVVRKCALALETAHDSGVIHRDLKPSNIMIDAQGEPIIMDFGLARRCDPARSQLTEHGTVMGTPAYMSPEQISGDVAAMGPACDIYSLGIVLYELLTGAPPYQGDLFALISQIVFDAPTTPSKKVPGLDTRLDPICLKALAKKPADRWLNMADFAAALAEFLLGESSLPGFAAVPVRAQPVQDSGPVLTLRVEGTPFLYRPLPSQTVITVGRQKRSLGDPPDHGNDFVLRVAGNERASTRISRRHFEIQRVGSDYVVIDHSKAGLQLNGEPLPKGKPMPIKAGDRLCVAGVVTLEVLMQSTTTGGAVSRVVQVPGPATPDKEKVIFEASLGDMVTMD